MTRIKALYLRKARKSDLDLFFSWANDSDVRQNAINSDPIQYENHVQWFNNKISEPNAYVYVAFFENVPCGQIRFDIEDNTAKIDFSIDAQHRGRGLGKLILKEGVAVFQEEVNHRYWVKGLVKQGNIASQKAFQKAGFQMKEESVIINEESFIVFYK
jgi:RimJ/RimL family protein N-acetyltransferase